MGIPISHSRMERMTKASFPIALARTTGREAQLFLTLIRRQRQSRARFATVNVDQQGGEDRVRQHELRNSAFRLFESGPQWPDATQFERLQKQAA